MLALAGAAVAAYLVYARYTAHAARLHDRRLRDRAALEVREGAPASRSPCSGSPPTSRSSRPRSPRGVEAAAIGAAIVLAGLAFGVYLIVIQVAVIDAICQWCLASDAILALLAIACAERLRRAAGSPHAHPRPPPMAGHG